MSLPAIAAAILLLWSASGCDEIKARRKIQDGNKLYSQEKFKESIASYEAALKLRPDLAIGWFNLGIVHSDLYIPGDKSPENEAHAQGAIDALNKYISMVPNDEDAHLLLIKMYTKSARYDGALEYYKKQYDKDPTKLDAIAQLADINAQALRWDESRKWWKVLAETATSIDAQGDAWYRYGHTYFKQVRAPEVKGEEKVRLADLGIAAMLKADAVRPNHPDTLSYINILYRQRAQGQGKSYIAQVDVATATSYLKKKEAAKAAQAPAPVPGAPPAPGAPAAPAAPSAPAAPAAPATPQSPAPTGSPK